MFLERSPEQHYKIQFSSPKQIQNIRASFQNANLLRSTENTSSNNHNNMTIQIGLQCLNDRLTAAASTTNSAVTPAAPVRGFNSGQQMDIGEKSNGHRSNAAQSTISEDSVDGANCREAVNRKLQEVSGA